MVLGNLTHYQSQLLSGQPLFTVQTLLSAPDIVLHPHANELFKLLMGAMKEVVDRYRHTYMFVHVLYHACNMCVLYMYRMCYFN